MGKKSKIIGIGRENQDQKEKVCCICGQTFHGWGNAPWPIKETGECCNACNFMEVIPARLRMIYKK